MVCVPATTALGKLYGISVGPGDPELITLKGLRLLQQAPVVAFPAGLKGKVGIAQQIVASFLKPEQLQVALEFPFVHDASTLTHAWTTAAEQVGQYLHRGVDVAFVSEGDVSFYSTFSYLSQTVQVLYPSVCIEAVPGVCSPLAAAAALKEPLILQEQRLVILPALYHVTELETALKMAEVVVLMKVSSVYEQVWAVLERLGLLDQSSVVERATQATQVVYRGLRDRPQLRLPYFSLLIVQVSAAKISKVRN